MEQSPDRPLSHNPPRDNLVGTDRPFVERLRDEAEFPYYDPPIASDFLRDQGIEHSEQTLAKLRCGGGGPKFACFGRFVRYRQDWLVDYARSRISGPLDSTSEAKSFRSAHSVVSAAATSAPTDSNAPTPAAKTSTDRLARNRLQCAKRPRKEHRPGGNDV
jgi:hypothetical protein